MSDKPTEVDFFGTQYWRNSKGLIHRDNDLPAVIASTGACYYYQNGRKHRDNDKPAETYLDGSCVWYQNDQLHRDNNLPAIVGSSRPCRKPWGQEGKDDLPEVIRPNSTCRWFQHGVFIKGGQYSPEEIEQFKLPYGGK